MNKPKSSARSKRSTATKQTDLVGQFFHSFKEDESSKRPTLCWQGQIIANPRPGWYQVQLFEWGFGNPTNRCLVSFSDMKKWFFYPDAESMRYSYEYGAARLYRSKESLQ